jgi:hypothetical protein
VTISVAEFDLGVQAWLGAEIFDPDRVLEVNWPNQPMVKPPHGFFTSSSDGGTSPWIEYQSRQEKRAGEKRRVYLLDPNPDALLYIIDTPEDYKRLAETYRQRHANPNNPEICPHWRKLAQEGPFDAIHMTAAAVADKSLWYASSWAVESTLWFRPKLTLLDPS